MRKGGLVTAFYLQRLLYNYLGTKEIINIQPDKKDRSKAKSYQVRQVRNFLKWNNITVGGVSNNEV